MIEAIAHRGLHRLVPENTMDAFAAAVAAGADAIELDVHATADGVVVVHHDRTPGGAAADRRLRGVPTDELSIADLAGFDVGGGARVPRLAEVLDYLRDKARVYVEIKGWSIEREVVQCVSDSRADCAIHSFNHRSVATVRELAPHIPRGLLEDARPADPVAVLKAVSARDLWPPHRVIDGSLVALVQAAGGRVIAWTANDREDWERLAAAGVDGICTDDVEAFVAWRERGSA